MALQIAAEHRSRRVVTNVAVLLLIGTTPTMPAAPTSSTNQHRRIIGQNVRLPILRYEDFQFICEDGLLMAINQEIWFCGLDKR